MRISPHISKPHKSVIMGRIEVGTQSKIKVKDNNSSKLRYIIIA